MGDWKSEQAFVMVADCWDSSVTQALEMAVVVMVMGRGTANATAVVSAFESGFLIAPALVGHSFSLLLLLSLLLLPF